MEGTASSGEAAPIQATPCETFPHRSPLFLHKVREIAARPGACAGEIPSWVWVTAWLFPAGGSRGF